MASGSDTTAADWAGRAGLRLDAARHRARAGFLHIGDAFRHDLGFVRRRGIGTLFGRYARVFRPRNSAALVREWSLGADAESTTDDRYSTAAHHVAPPTTTCSSPTAPSCGSGDATRSSALDRRPSPSATLTVRQASINSTMAASSSARIAARRCRERRADRRRVLDRTTAIGRRQRATAPQRAPGR